MAAKSPPWMKLELKTPDKTQVYAMAAHLKKDPDLMLGKLVRWWCWLDLHTTDEHTHMHPDSVDALLGCKGFARAMIAAGWAVLADDGAVDVVRWSEHNGKGAKSRVQNAVDVANCKANKKEKGKEVVRIETLPCHDLEKDKEYKDRLSLTREPTERATHHIAETPLAGRARPSNEEEVRDVMKACPNCMLAPAELDACASRFFNDMEACGWVDTKGRPIWEWQPAARSYLSGWVNNIRNGSRPAQKSKSSARMGCNDPNDYPMT